MINFSLSFLTSTNINFEFTVNFKLRMPSSSNKILTFQSALRNTTFIVVRHFCLYVSGAIEFRVIFYLLSNVSYLRGEFLK